MSFVRLPSGDVRKLLKNVLRMCVCVKSSVVKYSCSTYYSLLHPPAVVSTEYSTPERLARERCREYICCVDSRRQMAVWSTLLTFDRICPEERERCLVVSYIFFLSSTSESVLFVVKSSCK